jgi:AAHS family 4-hydroxybenzoate transporter-like MFS transporter
MAEVVQVSRLLDQRGLSSFHYNLIFWCVLLSLIDGYDIAAIAFAAPHLVREWGLKPGQLGPVFSASLVGILFGSALFGWIGDRYGRKTALISSNFLFGIFTLAAAYSTNLEQLFWLRLLAGLGIGGVIPNVVAINTESAPRKYRATLALIGVGFVPLGGAIPGLVAATLVPTHGWQILFTIGGIVPIALALIGLFTLPESVKYMALRESQRSKMEKAIAAIDPGFKIPPNATFVIEDEQQFPGFNPVYLFRQGLWLITPLLWLLFALNLMGYFFLLSWTPTLMAVLKLPPSVGALAGAMIQVGGTVGALVLARWFDCDRLGDRGAGRRLDRLCRHHVDDGACGRGVLCGLLRARHPDRHQRRRRAGLSDLAARQRLGLGAWHRTHRLDHRAARRCIVRRPAGREALYVVIAAICARRGGLLRHLEAQ